MKTALKKGIAYLALGSVLLLGCFELKHVKIILDDGMALGFEIDLSDTELGCRLCPILSEKPVVVGENEQSALSGPAQQTSAIRP
jgi:hypothetical protein